MTDILWLLAFGALYLGASVPFYRVPCHQDAGWHSYWARFRRRGVTLERQLNVLMGCARLGAKFLYVLWSAIFPIRDPDRLTRILSWPLTLAAALGLYTGLDAQGLPWPYPVASAGAFLVILAIPTLGLYFETSERTVNLLNVGLFLAALAYLNTSPSEAGTTVAALSLGAMVFAMFLLALFFKITQLAEYLAAWLVMFFHAPGMMPFLASVAGGLAGVAVFGAMLGALGILKAENLGLLGYLTGKSGKKKEAHRQDGHPVWLRALYQRFLNLRAYAPNVLLSTRSILFLAILGAAFGSGPSRDLALAWFVGAAVMLGLQGRFFGFHFIPLVLPMALLCGWGVVFLAGDGMLFGLHAKGPAAIVLGVLAIADLWNLLWARRNLEIDLRFVPRTLRGIIEKNRLAAAAAGIVEAGSAPDDYVLVWGTLPQFNVLCDRRSPINWLSTNANLMDPILPTWRDVMMERIRTTRPVYVLEADDHLPCEDILRETGLRYEKSREVLDGAGRLYELQAGV